MSYVEQDILKLQEHMRSLTAFGFVLLSLQCCVVYTGVCLFVFSMLFHGALLAYIRLFKKGFRRTLAHFSSKEKNNNRHLHAHPIRYDNYYKNTLPSFWLVLFATKRYHMVRMRTDVLRASTGPAVRVLSMLCCFSQFATAVEQS